MKYKLARYIAVIAALLLLLFFLQRIEKSNGQPGLPQWDTAHLIYTKHAKCRMHCRHITEDEIVSVLQKGKLNKNKSGISKKNDETYALEGWTKDNQHVRVVVTPEENGLLVITVIDLDQNWACDCD